MPSQSTQIRTFQDLIDFLEDATGLDSKRDGDLRRMRTAIDSAYTRLASERVWTYYQQIGRVNCNGAESTGTASYDHTGGTYERQVTLVGANFPSWATQGVYYLEGVPYEIDDRKSNSVITLSPNSNPGADVASTAEQTIVRDSYPLPVNCRSIRELQDLTRGSFPEYLSPSEILEYSRMQGGPSGRPLYYTVVGSPDFMGAKTIKFSPAPNANLVYDYFYERWPRPIRLQNNSRGVVTGSQGAFTMVGSQGASWNSLIEGAIIRISDSQSTPSGSFGSNPYLMERAVMSQDSTTSMTVDSPLTEAVANVGYVISDPLDIDTPVMWEALKTLSEMLMPRHPKRESRWYKGELEMAYSTAYQMAAAADNAVSHRRQASGGARGMMAYNVSPGASGPVV